MKKLLLVLVAVLYSFQASAQIVSPFLKDQSMANRSGYEFFVGREFGRPLITVNLVSGVREPGVYHIPVDTDFGQLLAYAGGALDTSNLDEVAVKRTLPKNEIQVIKYNFTESFSDRTNPLIVKDRDLIHIPAKTNMDNTLKWGTLLIALLSVVASTVIISRGTN